MTYQESKMSVEWLETKIQNEIATYGTISPKMISILTEHSKTIHKQQSKMIFESGRNYQLTGEGTFEEIYKELFEENHI